MFVRKAALRPVPAHAIVDERAVAVIEESLGDAQEDLQETLDRGYQELDRKQPVLGTWLADQVSSRNDELVQSLGYFLAVTVYMAFAEAFPTRLRQVDDGSLTMALDTLAADEELRADDPGEVFESDDVVAMGQPALLAFVQHHVEQALEQAGDDIDLSELDRIYRAVLVEVISLSHAVESPSGHVGPAALA
ncbi:MAG: hypothetical protein ACOCV4_04410 [Myxococcota bacterium]